MGLFGVYLLIIFVICLVIYCLLERRRYLKHLGQFHRHEPEFSIWEGIKFFLIKDEQKVHDEAFRKIASVKLPFLTFVLPTFPILSISNPKDIRAILTDHRSQKRPFFYQFTGAEAALINSPMDIWKVHKKIIGAVYGYNLLREQVPMITTKVKILLKKIEESSKNKSEFNLTEHLEALSAATFNSYISEKDIDGDSKEIQDFLTAIRLMGTAMEKAIFKPWRLFAIYFRNSALHQLSRNKNRAVENIYKPVLEERTKMLDSLSAEKQKALPKTLLNQLTVNLRDGNINYEELIDEITFNASAALDTITWTIHFVLIALALHPEVHAKVVDELKSIFVSPDMDVDYESIKKLNYLDLVIKESIRFFRFVPAIAREATEDIPLANYTVPRGTIICISLETISKDSSIWGPDVDKFNPERFEDKTRDHSFLYFSTGPKSCPGKIYSDIALKTILSQILVEYEPETHLSVNEIALKFAFHFRISNKEPIRLRKRKGFYEEK